MPSPPSSLRVGRADTHGALSLRHLLLVAALVAPACGDDGAGASDAAHDAGDSHDAAVGDAGDDDAADADVGDAASSDAPDAAGERATVDLITLARLTAVGTRPRVLFVREADDGIASVRDDVEATGWWLPPRGAAEATVDWLTVLHTTATVTRAVVEVDSDASGTWRLFDHCGGVEVAASAWRAGEEVAFAGVEAGCAVLEAAGDARVLRVALGADVAASALPAPPRPSVPGAAAASLGVIEGFYGVPWSWRERARIAADAPYVYAPKRDPLHRAEWRTPYPASFVASFAALSDTGAAFGISPFIDFDPGVDGAVLETKLAPFVDAGVRALWLLADDIEFDTDRPIDATLGELHATAANELLAWASARAGEPVALTFVPTVYSDERRTTLGSGDDYLRALRALDPGIDVAWTGPTTFATTMARSDLAEVTALVGRTPVFWDNYWANDGGDGFTGRLLGAPYRGRTLFATADEAAVPTYLNPSIEGTVAHAQLAMAAFDAARGDRDAPDAAEGAARAAAALDAHHLDGSADAAFRSLLAGVFEVFDASGEGVPAYAAFDEAVEAIDASLSAATLDAAALQHALGVFASMATMQDDLYRSRAISDLVDELWAPLDRVRIDGEHGLWRLVALRERLAGRDATGPARDADALLRSLGRQRYLYSVGVSDRLAGAARAAAGPALEPQAWTVAPAPACVVGEPLRWRPFGDHAATLAAGFLRVDDDGAVSAAVAVPGRYRGVVVAVQAAPLWWDVLLVDTVCTTRNP